MFTCEDTINVPDQQNITELLTTIDFDDLQMRNLLRKSQRDKSPESDGIYPHVIKKCANEVM